MSWVTILWSMNVAICLTLAIIHLLIYVRSPASRGQFLFAVSAISAAAIGWFELLMMCAETVPQMVQLVWWTNVPVCAVVVSVAWFTRIYMKAGAWWLVWLTTVLRFVALALNFGSSADSFQFQKITEIPELDFLGESISLVRGTTNPWIFIGQASSITLLVLLLQASAAVWRRGERRRALVLGLGMSAFVLFGAIHSGLVNYGAIQSPYLISFAYLGVNLAMGYELSGDFLRDAALAGKLKVSEAALQESDQRMRLALDSAGQGLWSWDHETNEVWATERTRRMYDLPATGPVSYGQFLDRIMPIDRNHFLECVRKASGGAGEFECEHRVRLADGAPRWIAATGRFDFDGDRKPRRMLGASRDITAQRAAESDAQQRRNELAHLSRVNMLGELSGSLAHELNQPLTAILSNAQAAQRFLNQDPLPMSELRDILTDIVSEDKRAGEVISRLRLLLKKGEVQHQRIDLQAVIQEVLKTVRSDLVNHGVVPHLAPSGALPDVAGDRVQIQQVLINLVMNACDALAGIPREERRILISTRLLGDTEVGVFVCDVGAGIPEDDLEKIFEPFITSKSHGLGLGLTVCRTLIAAHGGRLKASNNEGPGATVYFTLPVASGDLPNERDPA